MPHTLQLSEKSLPAEIVNWLRRLLENGAFGFLRTPDGEEFVVLRPRQLADLDVILSDPAFLSVLERGVSDAVAGRTMPLDASPELRNALHQAAPCSPAMAEAVDRGVADAMSGRTHHAQEGETLADLMRRVSDQR